MDNVVQRFVHTISCAVFLHLNVRIVFVCFVDTPDCDRADHTSWTLEEATAGNPLAQFLHARRVSSAIERAKWLQRSANAGFARAQNELGWALFQGDGVRANLVSAKKWLKKAADQGEAEAHYNLGLIAAQQGMIDEAVALFKTAAAGGVAAAMFNIGVSYYKGSHGLQQDLAAAWHWLEQSGDGTGLFLAAGIADGTDAAAGERLRQRSCATGHAPACAALASSAPDARQAKAWLAKAAKYGDKQAVRALQNEL